jgi:peptide/nickel transport system substrate-binding protein
MIGSLRWALAGTLAFGIAFASARARAENVLLELSDGVPSGLDVDGGAANYPASQEAMLNMIEPLVEYKPSTVNESGVQLYDYSQFVPALAESWSFDPATNVTTFKLRHGVTSCEGNPFSADDVLYTFARAKSISGAAPIGFFLSSVASIENFTPALFGKTPEAIASRKLGAEVTKVDDYTVQIKQTSPNKLLMTVLNITGLLTYDQKAMRAHATDDDPWTHAYSNSVNAPSFGAWCLESWRKDEEFTVRANPGYYRGKPFYDRVIVRKVPQSANRLAILRSGQAQVVEGLSPKELDSLKSDKAVQISGEYLNATLMMLANWKIKPLDNPKLREAIAEAIPYDAIIKTSYFGQAQQWRGMIPSAYPFYHQPSTQYSFDPKRAKQLLAEAGYPDGKGLEAFPDVFKLTYTAERESILGPTASLIQTRLRQIGIPIELNPMPGAQFSDRSIVKKDLPLALNDQSKPIGVDPVYALQLYFVSAPRGVSNASNFSDPALDALFDQAKVELDPTKRAAELADAQDLLMQKLAWIPIVENKLQYALQAGISGVTINPSQVLIWRNLHH